MFDLRRWLKVGALGRGTFQVMLWNALRMVAQLGWLLLAARAFGPAGYGLFAGLTGLALAASGVVGAGFGLLMYRDTVRDANAFHLRWRQTWFVVCLSGSLLGALFVRVMSAAYPDLPIGLLLAIAASELLGHPFMMHASHAFAAHGRVAYAAALPALFAAVRVLAMAIYATWVDAPDIADYGWFHLSASAVAMLLMWMLLRHMLAPLPVALSLTWQDLRSGLGFSSITISSTALASVDKAIILRLGGAEMAGYYAAAQRFALVVAMPVDALIAAALPRLFRSTDFNGGDIRLVKSLVIVVLSYGVAAAGFVWVAADALSWLLGERFMLAVEVIRMMALYLPFYCLRGLVGNLLLTSDLKAWRVSVECAGIAGLAIIGGLWLPQLGLIGAVWALVLSEAGMLAASVLVLLVMRGRAPNNFQKCLR